MTIDNWGRKVRDKCRFLGRKTEWRRKRSKVHGEERFDNVLHNTVPQIDQKAELCYFAVFGHVLAIFGKAGRGGKSVVSFSG